MSVIRTFIAVDLPQEVKRQIGEIIEGLKPFSQAVRWVRAEALHLTLKFLGEIPEERLPEVYTCVEKSAAQMAPFSFTLAGMGCFPDQKRPRVLWIGVQDGESSLQKLQGLVEGGLAGCGFPPEKRSFSPHLTIARVKSPRGIQTVIERLPSIDYRSAPIAVSSVKVMKSQLKPTGAEYSVLRAPSLKSPVPGE